jgi:hypothetical protein
MKLHLTRRPFRDTWTPVEGQSEREYRIRQAHPRRRDTLRAAVAFACYVAGVLVILAVLFVWLP